ncbi:MAG: hypothetical protein HFI33_12520 [Lachnospiraceae bacterium]|nr:hypothetical protein [Lachnospiraceae bacterium]
MDSFNRTNLQNIKDIFEKKTGVNLDSRRHFHPFKMAMVVVAVILCCWGTTAFAVNLFSALSGDDLGISATYEGNGIVSVQVENRSDKELHFQSVLRLMQWTTSEEIKPFAGKDVSFSNTNIPAHSSGTMTIDLSDAYDMALLETPLEGNDWYYFILTNNQFVFGQNWMCSVDFAESSITPTEYTTPITPLEADAELVAEIMEELRPYFESYTTDPAKRNQLSDEYLALCQRLLEQVDGTIVPSVSPVELTVIDSDKNPTFDTSVPLDMQLQLTSLHRRSTDGYDKIIGASHTEQALVLSACIPQQKGDMAGGVNVPLIYVFTYEKSRITDPQNYAFIRGQLLTFEQMEQYKIYEDGQYVCYDVSHLFYSELGPYVESMVSQRSDVYFDEQVWERIQNIYSYYKENLGRLLGYRDSASSVEPESESDVPSGNRNSE